MPLDDSDAPPVTVTARRMLRESLLALRAAASAASLERWSASITQRLDAMLADAPIGTLGFYWPHRGEYDARPVAVAAIARGVAAALPVVTTRGQALQFRRWLPDSVMVTGEHGIATPRDTMTLTPDLLLVPLVGFDDRGFRLGYGGGYFDRTLGALRGTVTIGVGFELARVASIDPLSHDVPMQLVVTESAIDAFAGGARDGGRQTLTVADARERIARLVARSKNGCGG